MSRLDSNPVVMQLARDLGLPWRINAVARIRDHALAIVDECRARCPWAVSVADLRSALCDRLSVCLETVSTDDDFDRITCAHGFSEAERRQLVDEFDNRDVEGWLVCSPVHRPGRRHYVAIVDGRGDRAPRAYFTAWHEIAHLIVTPPQLAFEGFRRSIPVNKRKDPVESMVDAVAGELAFFPPFIRPILEVELSSTGRLGFDVIEFVRLRAAPEASFYAAAIACVKLSSTPVLLVRIAPALKASEKAARSSPQLAMPIDMHRPTEKLRVVDVIASAAPTTLRIFKNMRVPLDSVLVSAHESETDVVLTAIEDQSSWETSSGGALPPQSICVEVMRRGSYVYGLIQPA